MNCKWEGCRSSKTANDVICEKSPPIPCPNGDIINTIDNNQKVFTQGILRKDQRYL